MKTVIFKISLLLLLLVIITSCTKKNAVPPSKKLSYQFKVITTAVPLSANINSSTLNTAAGANITWQSGYANVSSISFDGQNQNDNSNNEENNFSEPQVYKVDLFSSNQLLGNIDIATGTYHNVEIKVELKQTLTDSALFLKGIYTSASGNIPVELSLNGNNGGLLEIPVSTQDLTVGTIDSYIALINLHLDKLITGLTSTDLDSATITNGSILIDSSNNIAIYNKIQANINNFSDGNYNND
jgi:hypothetical protein